MKNMRKKVYRRIRPSKSLTPHNNRGVNGFAYTIIPSDIDREDYLKIVYQTGYAMLMTRDREILKDVAVPNHLIDSLKFPKESNQYGDLVSWSAVEKSNQLSINGIFKKPGDYHPYLENVHVTQYNSDQYKITTAIDGNIPLYSISVNAEDQGSGGVELKAQSSLGLAKVVVRTDGDVDIDADENVNILAEQSINIEISSQEGQITTLTIDKDLGLSYQDKNGSRVSIFNNVMLLDATVIRLGKLSISPAVKGDILLQLLSRLLTALQSLTVTSSSPGTPSSPPANAKEFADISSQLLALVVSKKVFVE